jgi:Fungal tRNA ligase phosphodiesterase domain
MPRAMQIVDRLLESTGKFVSAVLTPQSRVRLLQTVPPIHPVVHAHHVTMAFNPDPETLARYEAMVGKRVQIAVVAVSADQYGQAVLVGAESQNEYPHVTISVAEGVAPSYSNSLLASADHQHVPIFTLEADVVIEPLDETPTTHR